MDGKKRIVGLVILLLLLFPGGVCGTEIAAEDDSFSVLEDAVEDLDRIMGDHLSLEKLYHDMISGDFSFSPAAVLSAVQELIFQELRVSVSLFGQLLLFGVIASVFHVFSQSFSEGGAAKVGQWVIYLAFLLVAVSSFYTAMDIGSDVIYKAADFLYAVFPILLGAFALTGGAVASAVVQPTILMVVTLFLGLLERFFLPLVLIMAVLVICSNMSPRYSFKKFYGLLRSIFLCALGFLLTIFSGILGWEGFAAATADGLALKTVKMATGSFIPIVGGYIADAFDAILGAGVLLRSSIGIFGIVAVAVIIIGPALRLLLMSLLFKITAALLQPFGEDGYVTALSDFSSVILMLFALVAAAGLLFFFLIFCIVGVSTMTMLFR